MLHQTGTSTPPPQHGFLRQLAGFGRHFGNLGVVPQASVMAGTVGLGVLFSEHPVAATVTGGVALLAARFWPKAHPAHVPAPAFDAVPTAPMAAEPARQLPYGEILALAYSAPRISREEVIRCLADIDLAHLHRVKPLEFPLGVFIIQDGASLQVNAIAGRTRAATGVLGDDRIVLTESLDPAQLAWVGIVDKSGNRWLPVRNVSVSL
ncbi:MAG: hypothetical protein ACKVPX_13800 [Myxococcaceae bacterium]